MVKVEFKQAKLVERKDSKWECFTATLQNENPVGSEGKYNITFIIGVSSFVIGNATIFETDISENGDSFLQFFNPGINSDDDQIKGIQFKAIGPSGKTTECIIYINSSGRMSQLNFPDITADNFNDAEGKAYNFAQTILGWISLQYDIPVEITQIHSVELKTSSIRNSTFLSPGVRELDEKFEIPLYMPPAIIECVLQYREAHNSINEFYRLFCFFKCAEGLKHVRVKIDKTSVRSNLKLLVRKRRPRIPDDLARSCNMTHLAGKKLTDARDELWEISRNELAHLDLQTGKYLSLHTIEDLYRVRRLIPIMQYIVKTIIKEEIEAYKELAKYTGSIVTL